MSEKVVIPAPLRKFTRGAEEIELLAQTVQGVIDALDSQFPGIRGGVCETSGALRRFINIYVDGEDVRFLNDLATPVRDGSEVAIIPAIAGGRSEDRDA
jgi:molybdopterin converting factor small subunit